MTLVPEVKKPPPPVTKEPNTGQTIHPPDTTEGIETLPNKTELNEKKESVSNRVNKSKRKPTKQQKKEEKARKKDKGKDKEREKEKEVPDKSDVKQQTGSPGDSSSSNSTEQLEVDFSSPTVAENTIPSPPVESNVNLNNEVTDSEPVAVKETIVENVVSVLPLENKEVPPVAPAVPSSAIKTGRTKRQNSKEGPPSDPFSRVPDRSTYSTKKNSTSKKPPPPPIEKIKQPVSNKNISPPSVEMNFEPPAPPETEEVVVKPRPQTLPVIVNTEVIEEPILELPIDSADCLVETDGVFQTLLSVESNKNGSQSLPTSPHELAASLLSNNSAIMRRKQKSDRGKLDDDDLDEEDEDEDEDDEQQHEQDERTETEILEPIEPQLTQRKDDYPGHDQYKSLSTLSLNAEPFYPSPTFASKSGPSRGGDPRKYGPDPTSRPHRGPPPGLSPTPDDPYMRPYPDVPYFKRPRPSRGGKSMTPSPPLPNYFAEGPPMPYGDYPPLDHDPMLGDEPPYGGLEDFPPIPMGRHGRDRYRAHSPMMVPKGGMGRQNMHPNMEAYMHHMYMQRAREYGYRPHVPWEHHPPSHRAKPHPADEVMHHDRQYLRKRQYIMRLIEEERAIAAMERKQSKHSIETPPPPPANFEPDTSPSFSGTRGWDNATTTTMIDPPTEELDPVRYRPSRLLPDKPLRRRTYSMESNLGGEFVTDFPAPSSVGAPGQQFSSRADKASSGSVGNKDLAPGRSQSAGWPEGTQVRDTFKPAYNSLCVCMYVCKPVGVVIMIYRISHKFSRV